MAHHARTAGAIVDDDSIAAQILDVFREQARTDIHAAAGRIHDGELDRLSGEILRLQFCKVCLRIALRPGRRGKQSNDQGASNPGPFHGSPPSVFVRRRNIRNVSATLAASNSAVTGRLMRIIAPSGDMTSDCRSDCSRRGASTNAMTKGARSYSSLRSTQPATPNPSITQRSKTFLFAE